MTKTNVIESKRFVVRKSLIGKCHTILIRIRLDNTYVTTKQQHEQNTINDSRGDSDSGNSDDDLLCCSSYDCLCNVIHICELVYNCKQ